MNFRCFDEFRLMMKFWAAINCFNQKLIKHMSSGFWLWVAKCYRTEKNTHAISYSPGLHLKRAFTLILF